MFWKNYLGDDGVNLGDLGTSSSTVAQSKAVYSPFEPTFLICQPVWSYPTKMTPPVFNLCGCTAQATSIPR